MLKYEWINSNLEEYLESSSNNSFEEEEEEEKLTPVVSFERTISVVE